MNLSISPSIVHCRLHLNRSKRLAPVMCNRMSHSERLKSLDKMSPPFLTFATGYMIKQFVQSDLVQPEELVFGTELLLYTLIFNLLLPIRR